MKSHFDFQTTPSGEAGPAAQMRSKYFELFLISFVILFFELACIRWFGSMVVFLNFFTNLILMACFLGMSVGCLAASRRQDLIRTVLPLALLAVTLSVAILWAYDRYGRYGTNPGEALFIIDVGGQDRSPQNVYFGTEYYSKDPSRFMVPIEVIAGSFFVLVALMFVGLGQAMGRAFNAIPNRVAAYTTNVFGSLAGVVVFGAASYFGTPAYVWFCLVAACCLYFMRPLNYFQVGVQMVLLLVLAFTSYNENKRMLTFWSPYYKIYYDPLLGRIAINNMGHQRMMRPAEQAPAYSLPHLLNRDAGGGRFQEVLIIGAGSGNDVQAALMHGAEHIDAIEIEPVINAIGRANHPDRPYTDPRVTIHLDDGRSFIRKTQRKYDLVIYALVDSLVLHSGYSSLRLENFLFTEQAFRDVKNVLKPGGVFIMYNWYRQGFIIGRLAKMAEDVFGGKPLVFALPYNEKIPPESQNGMTFVIAGAPDAPALSAIRHKLETFQAFWINTTPKLGFGINAYGPKPPPAAAGDKSQVTWEKIAPAAVDTSSVLSVPTDDWPFLYLREPTIPMLNIRGIVMIAVLSLLILFTFAPVRTARPNGQMFFLGAGFMLLESKGVVHMALLFGSTWVVNSIVFFAILVMILLSNLFVTVVRPRRLWPYYALLIVALGVNMGVPMSWFLGLPTAAQVLTSCLVVFIPVFFAGIVFAASFRDSTQPDIDFGSNIGGVILGGLSEYLSLMVGFNALIGIAIGYYLLSAMLRPRPVLVPAAGFNSAALR
jgi:SAM-dependent methyltransferase